MTRRKDVIMRRIIIGVVAAVAALLTFAGPSYAGSDSPTPYTVSIDGIHLPQGQVFPDNGHINVRSGGVTYNVHFEGKCVTRTDAECAGARHDTAQYIGEGFIPWTVILGSDVKKPWCVDWVQLSGFNEHFGEGGQSPVGTGCATPEPEPTLPPLPADEVVTGGWLFEVTCDTQVGDVVPAHRTVTTTRYEYVDGQPAGTSSTWTEDGTHTVAAPDLFDLDCVEETETPAPTPSETGDPLPETGGTFNPLPVFAVGVVLAVAGVVLSRRSARS